MVKKIITALMLFVVAHTWLLTVAIAQEDKPGQLKAIMNRIQELYMNPDFLSFNVSYTYAHENAVSEKIDELSGRIQLNHSNYYCAISNTETIKKDSSAIILFGEDKLMYLSKTPQAPSYNQPVATLDSMMKVLAKLHFVITKEEHGKTRLNFTFPPGAPYLQLEMLVDNKSGYLDKMVYHISNTTLNKEGQEVTGNDRVEASFFNYNTSAFDTGVFDPARYYTKANNELKVTDKYRDYTIFLGTPNL